MRRKIKKSLEINSEDIDSAVFEDELRHFPHFANSDESATSKSPGELYKLVTNGLSATFPNVTSRSAISETNHLEAIRQFA